MCSTTKSKFSPLGGICRAHTALTVSAMSLKVSATLARRRAAPVRPWDCTGGAGGGKIVRSHSPGRATAAQRPTPPPAASGSTPAASGAASAPTVQPATKTPAQRHRSPGNRQAAPQAAQRHTEGRIAQLGTGRRQGGRQGDAEYRRLLQRPGDGCAEPRRSRQCQARSQRSEGTALEAGRPHRQPEAGPARLLYRKTEKRPADSRRQQGRASRGDGLARVQDAPRQKNAQGLDGQQRKAPGPGRRAGIAAAEPPPRHGSRQRPRQFEPHGHRLKEQTPRQRPHAGSQQIGRRTPDDQRQPEGRGAAVDLPGAQHRPRDSRGPLPGQRRPPRPRGQQRLQPERRSMYLLVGIGKDSHRSVPPLCCMPYGSCTIPRGNRRFLPQAGEIQKLVGNCAFVPRPDKPCRKSRQKSGVPGRSPQNNKKDGPRAQSSRRGRPQLREK